MMPEGHLDAAREARPLQAAVPEWVLQGALLLLFVGVAAMALGFEPESRLFPLIVGTIGAGLTAGLILYGFAWPDVAAPLKAANGNKRIPRDVIIGVAAAPIYSGLVWLAGFYVASPLALIVMPWLLGYRNLLVLLPLTVVMTAIFAAVFSYAMDLSLPPGLLGHWFLARFIDLD